MKTWHFDIKLGNGQVASIDAYTFEEAFAILKLDNRFIEGNWSLVGVEDKIPEHDPTAEEIEGKSEELWRKLDYNALLDARTVLEVGCKALKDALEFDEAHQDVLQNGPNLANGKCQLEAAKKCIEYAHRWIDA